MKYNLAFVAFLLANCLHADDNITEINTSNQAQSSIIEEFKQKGSKLVNAFVDVISNDHEKAPITQMNDNKKNLSSHEFKIATYNVDNLFDEVQDGTEYREFRPSMGWNKKKAIAKLNEVSQVIDSLDADILALQEIENSKVTKRLAKMSQYKYHAFIKPKGSPFGVALLSRFPIISWKAYDTNVKKTRSFLNAIVKVGNEKLSIFVVHFPTYKFSPYKRRQVALALKEAINKSEDRSNLILLGDFNTNIADNSVLKEVFGALDKQNDFYDPWHSIEHKQRHSHVSRRAIDRILVGSGLYDEKGLEYKNASFKVRKEFKNYSDHYPIELVISDKKSKFKISSIDDIKTNDFTEPKLLKEVLIKRVDYKHEIFYQDDNEVFVYNPYSVQDCQIADILVTSMGTYNGKKQILAYEVIKNHKKDSSCR